MFIYCTQEQKRRLRTVAESQGRTLSGYVIYHLMHQLKKDEATRR